MFQEFSSSRSFDYLIKHKEYAKFIIHSLEDQCTRYLVTGTIIRNEVNGVPIGLFDRQ